MEEVAHESIWFTEGILPAFKARWVREEVLGPLKETLEGLLEALRDEVVRRGRYERREAPRLYRYGLQGEEVAGDLLGDHLEGEDPQGQGS